MRSKLSFIFLLLFFLFPKSAFAQGEFITDIIVDYQVRESGLTNIRHTITLANAFSDLYATSYSLVLEGISPENERAHQEGNPLELEKKIEGNLVSLKVNFTDSLVGKGKKRTFVVEFDEDSFAERTGEVWEISIPRLADEKAFRSYKVNFSVPSSFGNEAYITPSPLEKEDKGGRIFYSFDKETIAKTGISAGFGQFQVFSFTLNYHLENPLKKKAITEIAVPPDTAYQKVYYEDINPSPENIRVDKDGNWIATYILDSRERLDITAIGSVQIFATPRVISSQSVDFEAMTQESEFWEVNDSRITSLAETLNTPRAIYDFVSTNLSYDLERVRPNVQRLGAKNALASPNSAICMEYTDLFVTLARSAGIPAREVNGFAYTENPDIQPLSLVADVLHAWPEYWNEKKGVWVPVDPTWGSTTGGVDYFNQLDLRHFTFVVHGLNPREPYSPGSYKLGPNPQKDVFVSFGQLPAEKTSKPQVEAEPKRGFPFLNSKIDIKIANPGPVALYDLETEVYFDSRLEEKETTLALPPFSLNSFEVTVPFSFLGKNTPGQVVIVAGDTSLTIPTFKTQVIIYNLIAIFLILSLVITLVFFRMKNIKIKEFLTSLREKLKVKRGHENRQEQDKGEEGNQEVN